MELTLREIEAVRLCHHDFRGLSTIEAAKEMKISRQRICQLLKSAERKAPRLFPILTREQNKIYKLVTEQGLTHSQIADTLGITVGTVTQVISTIKAKGVIIVNHPKTVPYENWMDGEIREKF